MIRSLNILLTLTSVLALIGVYALKYSVEETAAEKKAMQATIAKQESDLSLLEADWAYLNQPGRVAPIVKRHAEVLGLVAVNQKQFGSISTIPMRPVELNPAALDQLIETLDSGIDPIDQLLGESE